MTTKPLNTLQLSDDEFTQILSALYCKWDSLRDELSDGPEYNDGWEEDGLLWAIRGNQELLVKLVEIRPDYRYLVADAIKRLV